MSKTTAPLVLSDVPMMWEINEQGLPGTGQVTQEEMAVLLALSEVSLGAYQDGKLIGFVLCLLPKIEYGSLNYAWFNQRYDQFIYVDRIAVAKDSRNSGIGTLLYQQVFDYATQHNIPVTAEVSLKPSNEGSDRFHLRHGFVTVGKLDHGDKAVTMYIKDKKPEDD
jgi:predicted GNAT superfamily acetyltransferase